MLAQVEAKNYAMFVTHVQPPMHTNLENAAYILQLWYTPR